MLDVCLLGTGGVMPLPHRWLTALLVRYKGRMILFDCGEGTQVPLMQVGWGFKSIEAIFITHYHADHITGLPGLLLTMGNCGKTEPLRIFGPPGLSEVVAGLTVIAPELPFELELRELSGERFITNILGDIFIHSIPAKHTLPCLSYCLEIKRAGKFDPERAQKQNIPLKFWSRLQSGEEILLGRQIFTPDMVLGKPRRSLKLCFVTDTRPIGALADFAGNADLLVCEGMYGEDEKLPLAEEKGHMLFSEAAGLAAKSGVQELWLAHYSPSLVEPANYINQAKNIFAKAVLGKDLLQTTLFFRE